MIKRMHGSDGRHRSAPAFMNQSIANILKTVEEETKDPALPKSIAFGPTALTHIRRLTETGGSIITDTSLLANDINTNLLGNKGARVMSFIDDPGVVSLAAQRRITRAEVAVDYGLAVPGPKLLVIGSAPAAINRIIQRRQREPMSEVCVLAAPNAFASAVQIKERLLESGITSIVVRGKKGGIPATVALLNAILLEISEHPNP